MLRLPSVLQLEARHCTNWTVYTRVRFHGLSIDLQRFNQTVIGMAVRYCIPGRRFLRGCRVAEGAERLNSGFVSWAKATAN